MMRALVKGGYSLLNEEQSGSRCVEGLVTKAG